MINQFGQLKVNTIFHIPAPLPGSPLLRSPLSIPAPAGPPTVKSLFNTWVAHTEVQPMGIRVLLMIAVVCG